MKNKRTHTFMPPTSKKLRGHNGLGLCMRTCMRESVTLCIQSRMVIEIGLWNNKYEK